LHLILTVIPDPIICIKEAERVLKQGGQIAIYDKFVRKNRKASILRKTANLITSFLFSDITSVFESIVEKTGLSILSDVDADLNGNFRLIKLEKNKNNIQS
jgi:phosphatidylethanolamine/phosphatidyl-N-methylethanolamine N-methyltransferase